MHSQWLQGSMCIRLGGHIHGFCVWAEVVFLAIMFLAGLVLCLRWLPQRSSIKIQQNGIVGQM